MGTRTLLHQFGMVAVMAIAFTLGVRTMPAQSQDSEGISKLLALAKSHAAQVENDAATLESYTRSKVGWQSNAQKLSEIKEHINALGKVNKDLDDERALGSPWQQKAIDQIDPLLREMANVLTVTIMHLNDHPSQVHLSAYRDYAHANSELASKTAGMIRDFVDYDEAKSKAESLEAKLELSTSEKTD
jgi:hypothetical protein